MERVIPIQGVPSAAAFAFMVTALTVIVSAAVYRWIEKPSIAAGKAIAARRASSALTTPGRADGPA
jgi:peptidoglycan/LPS O-acetylase OafA/YrhL